MNYHAQPQNAEGGYDPKYGMQFSDASIRAGFIRKVFIMVTIMVSDLFEELILYELLARYCCRNVGCSLYEL